MTSARATTRAALTIAVSLLSLPAARADEGGVSFWIPGQFGNFAALPSPTGLSMPVFYYHVTGTAGSSKQFELGGNVAAGVQALGDLVFAFPTYAFAPSLLGGQLTLGAGIGVGRVNVSAEVVLTGPRGRTFTGTPSDTTWGNTDIYPSAQLKWHQGIHNELVYVNAGAPVGSYETGRLANVGIGHWAIDGGVGYTYLDPHNGRTASLTVGATYNFENNDTNYQNGIDSHADFGVAQFVSKQLYIGTVGYAYVQLSGDRGSGDVVGSFRSRVFGVGPNIGYNFNSFGRTIAAQFRSDYQFGGDNRATGWDVFLTIVFPLIVTPPPQPAGT